MARSIRWWMCAATLVACGPSAQLDAGFDAGDDAAPDATADASGDDGFACTPGEPACDGRRHYVCGEDGASREDEVVCEAGCDPAEGCVACEPDTRVCDGTVSLICNAEGTGWLYGRDCAEWGSACVAGYCDDPCAQAEAARSYMGCEYFAVPLAQIHELKEDLFDFRIVVANPSPRTVQVSVHRGNVLLARRRIVPGDAVDIALPWIDGLSFPSGESWDHSVVVTDGAYRISSDYPVIVSQYNPFHYAYFGGGGVVHSETNDASLLLPTHSLGYEHLAVSYAPISQENLSIPGWIALVGTAPEGTTVQVVATAPIAADVGGRWGDVAASETFSFTLGRGEVAQLLAAPRPCEDGACHQPEADPTGSVIRSDRPVAAFSGHACAFVPYDVRACDHLEAQIAPVSTWGERFETMPMIEPGTGVPNLVRIVAARDDTQVTIGPPLARSMGGDPVVDAAELDAGQYLQLWLDRPASIAADGPIQVGQLLLGQHMTDPPLERGDPSLTMLVPAEQFRYEYVFVAPSSYADSPDGRSYVLVSRMPGVPIELDGAQIEAEWTLVGERELAIVQVSGGAHHAVSASPFGLVSYGLGSYTSYAHPAGLDLHVLR